MKSKMKKILSMMLIFCMMFSMVPTTAFAAGTEISEAELFEQVKFSNVLIGDEWIVNSAGNGFTKTSGSGWELKYSQDGYKIYLDVYLENANFSNGINIVGEMQTDETYAVVFRLHVKGECNINKLYVEIPHKDQVKYGYDGTSSNLNNSTLNAGIVFDSPNSTLSAPNGIQTKGLYNVLLVADGGSNRGTLNCNYFDTTARSSVSKISMFRVNLVAKATSGTGSVFNVGDCTIEFTNCNTLFNLPEGMVPFAWGHNNVTYKNTMVEYGGKLEEKTIGGSTSDYVDSNRYAAIMSSYNLGDYLEFASQDPAMPSGNTETDITAILGNTETYQFNNAALPNWLADGGFNVYRSGSLYKGTNTTPIERVANGNSSAIEVNHTFDAADSYKLVEDLTLKYFDKSLSDIVDAHNGYKKNTFNITTVEAPKFTTQPVGGEVNAGEKHTVTWATDFTPVKQYVKAYNSDNTDNYSVPIDADATSYSVYASDGYYRIRAYYGEGATDYVDSDKIVVTEGEATITGITINPTSAEVEKGKNQQFAATVTVTGTGDFNKNVTWSVSGGTASAIDGNGLLTIGTGETATTLTVKATAAGDTTKFAEATVTVKTPAAATEIDSITIEGLPAPQIGQTVKEFYDLWNGKMENGTVTVNGEKYDSSKYSFGNIYEDSWYLYNKNKEQLGYYDDGDVVITEGTYYLDIYLFTKENKTGHKFADEVTVTVPGADAVEVERDGNDVLVYAKFVLTASAPTEYTITVDGGTASVEGSAVTTATADTEVTLTINESAIPAGKAFDKWEVVSGGVTIEDNKFTMPANAVEIKATYKDATVVPVTYTVSFEANGGSGTMADVTGIFGEYTLPANGFTALDGKQFKAWSVGGVEKAVGDKITVAADTTVTAVWEDAPAHEHTYATEWSKDTTHHWYAATCGHDVVKGKAEHNWPAWPLTITPTCQQENITQERACADGCGAKESRTITAIHLSADKWSTDKTNHWKVCQYGCGTIVVAKEAHDYGSDRVCDTCNYKKPYSGGSGGGFSGVYNYQVVIIENDDAAMKADKSSAVSGEKVTVTVTPDAGKAIDEVIITDNNGKVIPVTKTGDNKYTFTMPASKVTVAATMEDADYSLRIVMQINNKAILVNGKTMMNDVAPLIVDDRTLVPIRVVTELLGGEADWDNATRTVTLTIDGKELSMVIGKVIPGYGTPATIMNDRTYVPVRYVMEKLGADVEWIAQTQQIIIEK